MSAAPTTHNGLNMNFGASIPERVEENYLKQAGLLAYPICSTFPAFRASGVIRTDYQRGLQLQVQLRFFTGFPCITAH